MVVLRHNQLIQYLQLPSHWVYELQKQGLYLERFISVIPHVFYSSRRKPRGRCVVICIPPKNTDGELRVRLLFGGGFLSLHLVHPCKTFHASFNISAI